MIRRVPNRGVPLDLGLIHGTVERHRQLTAEAPLLVRDLHRHLLSGCIRTPQWHNQHKQNRKSFHFAYLSMSAPRPLLAVRVTVAFFARSKYLSIDPPGTPVTRGPWLFLRLYLLCCERPGSMPLGPVQIFFIKFLGDSAHVSLFNCRLDLHLMRQIFID